MKISDEDKTYLAIKYNIRERRDSVSVFIRHSIPYTFFTINQYEFGYGVLVYIRFNQIDYFYSRLLEFDKSNYNE